MNPVIVAAVVFAVFGGWVGALILILLLLSILGAPVWRADPPAYGWYPSAGLGTILLVILVLALLGVF